MRYIAYNMVLLLMGLVGSLALGKSGSHCPVISRSLAKTARLFRLSDTRCSCFIFMREAGTRQIGLALVVSNSDQRAQQLFGAHEGEDDQLKGQPGLNVAGVAIELGQELGQVVMMQAGRWVTLRCVSTPARWAAGLAVSLPVCTPLANTTWICCSTREATSSPPSLDFADRFQHFGRGNGLDRFASDVGEDFFFKPAQHARGMVRRPSAHFSGVPFARDHFEGIDDGVTGLFPRTGKRCFGV